MLLERFKALVCDLDGVVYAGPHAIDGAVDALNAATRGQADVELRPVMFATNNASRPPKEVAEHLVKLGIETDAHAVINSSMAAAHVVHQQFGGSAAVLAIGGQGVPDALTEHGLTVVTPEQHRGGAHVDAVVQGLGTQVTQPDLAEAAYAVQGGAHWVATNTDRTLPTDRGIAPGNGTLVDAVRAAVSVDPEVVGKPAPVMYDLAASKLGLEAASILAIGDRLETDIEGGNAAGMATALVLTGVHGWADAAAVGIALRPDFVIRDLGGLYRPYDVSALPTVEADAFGGVCTGIEDARAALAKAWELVDAGTWTSGQAREAVSAWVGDAA